MAEARPPRKAVITAAGLGTRFLPATKAVPKELLPVVDVPAMQYVVEEAAAAGLTEVLVVTSRGKDAIADHFDAAPEIEAALEAKGDQARLAAVRHPAGLAEMQYVRQDHPRGLGHAVSRARAFVGDEPFAVLLGDDLIDPREDLLVRMTRVGAETGGCVLALMPVGHDRIELYGAAAVEPTAADGVVRVTGLVEKPAPGTAPSDLAVIGRYVLAPQVFDVLERTPAGHGAEVQLTDALAGMIGAGEPVHGVVFDGLRYDIGDRLEYLQTVVRLACEHDELGGPFRRWLDKFAAEQR